MRFIRNYFRLLKTMIYSSNPIKRIPSKEMEFKKKQLFHIWDKRTDQREALRLQHHPQVTALEQLPLLHPWYPRSHLRRHYPRSRSTLHQHPVLYVTFPPGSNKPFWNDLVSEEQILVSAIL